MHVTKRIDLLLLEQELLAASVPISGLGHSGTDTDGEVYTFTAPTDGTLGEATELPPEAQPVVDAHAAPPRVIDYAAAVEIDAVKRTTNATATELLRFPLDPMTGYDIVATVMGVDAGNGAVKKMKLDVTIKRLGAGPVAVGAPTTTVSHQDAPASAWAVSLTFSGNDALVSVTGAAARNIDWICRAAVGRFAPAGLA